MTSRRGFFGKVLGGIAVALGVKAAQPQAPRPMLFVQTLDGPVRLRGYWSMKPSPTPGIVRATWVPNE